MEKNDKEINLYESLEEFVNSRPETQAAKKIKEVIVSMKQGAETLSLEISPLQPCISKIEDKKIYWNAPGCLPRDVFIRGSMSEASIIFPVKARQDV